MELIQRLSDTIRPIINDSNTELMLEQFYALLLTRLIDETLLAQLSEKFKNIDSDDELLQFINHIWQNEDDRKTIVLELANSHHVPLAVVKNATAKATPFVYKEVSDQANITTMTEYTFIQQSFVEIADLLPPWTKSVIPSHIFNILDSLLTTHNHTTQTMQHASSPSTYMTQTNEQSLSLRESGSHQSMMNTYPHSNTHDSVHSNAHDSTYSNDDNVAPISLKKNDTLAATEALLDNKTSYRQQTKRSGGLLRVFVPVCVLFITLATGSVYLLNKKESNISSEPTPITATNVTNTDDSILDNTVSVPEKITPDNQLIQNSNVEDVKQPAIKKPAKLNTQVYVFNAEELNPQKIEDIDVTLLDEVLLDEPQKVPNNSNNNTTVNSNVEREMQPRKMIREEEMSVE